MLVEALPPVPSKFKSANLGALAAIKAAPGTFYSLVVINGSAAAAFIQIFDALVANVTLGTTVPDLQFTVAAGAAFTVLLPQGVTMSAGISIASTTLQSGSVASAASVYGAVLYA